MVASGRERLRGTVEVDESLIGGVHLGGTRGRSTERKTLVAGAVEVRKAKKRGQRMAGRIRLRAVVDASAASLGGFLEDHVFPGTTILTDGHMGYHRVSAQGYDHRPETAATLPLIHREFANLKTWLRGTHHDRVERQHLQAYLNEFTFRHNRRFWPFSAFRRVLELGFQAPASTYREMYSTDEFGTGIHPR